MTSGVPWQIRGVSLHTREAAREAARRSGISVGEWLDRVILDLALQDGVDPRRCVQSLSDPHDGGDENTPPSCDLGWAVKPPCDDLAKISPMLRETVPRKAVEALESELRKLADRIEYTRHAGGDGTGLASVVRGLAETREPLRAATPAESLLGMARAVQQLSQNVAKLIEKLGACDARLNHLEAIERGLAELLVHLARQRVPTLARVAAPPPDLAALSHDVAALRQTEKKTQDSLEVVRGMLRHVVDRLAVIETDMRGEAASPPDAPPAPKADGLASPSQITSMPPIAPATHATPSTAEQASTAPLTSTSAALSVTEHCPIDQNPPPDHPVDMASEKAHGQSPASPADRVLVSESVLGGVKPSIDPDCGCKSDFIAAARRAAQADRNLASANDASAVSKIAFSGGSASDVGRLRALIGGTAAILIVVGLLQIARILVAPSDAVKLSMPGEAAGSVDALPSAVAAASSAAELASPAPAALPPAGRQPAIFSAVDGAAVATSESGILVPVWTPEQEPEATGQIQTSRQRWDRAGATTTASAPASAKPAPPAAPPNLDLAMPRPAQ
jgi:localization factor PodJL